MSIAFVYGKLLWLICVFAVPMVRAMIITPPSLPVTPVPPAFAVPAVPPAPAAPPGPPGQFGCGVADGLARALEPVSPALWFAAGNVKYPAL
jgi:hypothetical protein